MAHIEYSPSSSQPPPLITVILRPFPIIIRFYNVVPPSDGVNMHGQAGSLGDWGLMDFRAVATYPKHTIRITD